MIKAWEHFKTITKHRHKVIAHCYKAGILFQGLFHDLSKYSPTEFKVGAKYYTGVKSPNEGERADRGYSVSCTPGQTLPKGRQGPADGQRGSPR